jgi:hypothetical protein
MERSKGTIELTINDTRQINLVEIGGTLKVDWVKYRRGYSILDCLKPDNVIRR